MDYPISLPWVHRLRFTRRAFDPANSVLANLLEAPAGPPARVLAFADQGTLVACPGLPAEVDAYARAHAGALAVVQPVLAVPGGEAAKNDPAIVERVCRQIHDARIDRQSYVLAIGGGAMLDVVGFAAAVVHRGVRLIRLPTTTLAQADSGVGVKNGINAFGKKNFLGVFAVPWAVINDEAFLPTLSDADWRCGFTEAVKVALLKDAGFFGEIASAAAAIRRRDLEAGVRIIRRSAVFHVEHIARGGDPFELTAARPLDFGHWSAHKLEQMTGFSLRHGEAVAVGLALDTTYCHLAGLLAGDTVRAIHRVLRDLGLPITHPALADADHLLQGLEEFREHLGGPLTITLIQGIGQPVDVHQIDLPLMRQAISGLC